MNSGSEDPEILLSDPGQWTEPWGESEHGQGCSKCGGERTVRYRCWSCLLSGTDPGCAMCGGRVEWIGECPVCRGTGIVDGRPRRGVSVFPTRKGLYHYMIGKGADLENCWDLELEALPSDDVDFDADQGALLAIPTRIVVCGRVDRSLAAEISDRFGSLDRSAQ